MIKGKSLEAWAIDVDAKIQALLTWAETGVAPGPQGGIAPLIGIMSTSFNSGAILSKENKVV
jgi:hypothetical protein